MHVFNEVYVCVCVLVCTCVYDCICVCVINCTATLCALAASCSELGRIPWSDGMFKVHQLSLSVQRAAKATRLKQRHQTLSSAAAMIMCS